MNINYSTQTSTTITCVKVICNLISDTSSLDISVTRMMGQGRREGHLRREIINMCLSFCSGFLPILHKWVKTLLQQEKKKKKERKDPAAAEDKDRVKLPLCSDLP